MKKIKLYAMCLMAAVATLGTSCSEQTSLTIDQIPGRAKMAGQISYPTGTEWNATTSTIESKFAVAANKKVFVEVQNDAFKPGAGGISTFETTTDAKGYYEIEIPISGNENMPITIRAETFTGETREYKGMSTDTPPAPIYKTTPVTYSYDALSSVNSTTVTVKDITYNSIPRDLHN